MFSLRILALLCLCCAATPSGAVSIMVNEYWNGSAAVNPATKMAADEYIEFVIVEQSTAAQLAALTFGDANAATSQIQGVFQFDQATLQQVLTQANLTAFQPGTIIVVKGTGLGPQDLSYNPTALNMADENAWNIQLVAGQGARDAPETRINRNLSIDNNGDVVWIASGTPARSNDTSGFLYAIGHDNSPGKVARTVRTQFGTENILASTVAAGRAVMNLGTSNELLSASSTGSMGSGNSLANTAWIAGSLRITATFEQAPEVSRAGMLLAGLAAALCKRRRAGKGGSHHA